MAREIKLIDALKAIDPNLYSLGRQAMSEDLAAIRHGVPVKAVSSAKRFLDETLPQHFDLEWPIMNKDSGGMWPDIIPTSEKAKQIYPSGELAYQQQSHDYGNKLARNSYKLQDSHEPIIKELVESRFKKGSEVAPESILGHNDYSEIALPLGDKNTKLAGVRVNPFAPSPEMLRLAKKENVPLYAWDYPTGEALGSTSGYAMDAATKAAFDKMKQLRKEKSFDESSWVTKRINGIDYLVPEEMPDAVSPSSFTGIPFHLWGR
jgi:hypothetical protein